MKVGQRPFPDRIAYGGWSLDDHHPEGFFFDGPPVPIENQYIGHRFSIPYRSLYSRNIANLLMAGRNISASHIGLSDTRVMLTCAVIGDAAGTAAGLCIRHGTTPRGIHGDHLDELQQQLLKTGAHIIELPNRDPDDLARRAVVSASSRSRARAPPSGSPFAWSRRTHPSTPSPRCRRFRQVCACWSSSRWR